MKFLSRTIIEYPKCHKKPSKSKTITFHAWNENWNKNNTRHEQEKERVSSVIVEKTTLSHAHSTKQQ